MQIRGGVTAAILVLAILVVAVPTAKGKARLDSGFGKQGVATTGHVPELGDLGGATSIVETKDGGIVALGAPQYASGPTVLARFTPGGRIDKYFADDGYLIAMNGESESGLGGWGQGIDLAVGQRGRLVSTGGHFGEDCGQTAFLARVFPDGSNDRHFGSRGVTHSCLIRPAGPPYVGVFYTFDLNPRSVALTGNGKILVAGESIQDRRRSGAFVARYRDNGQLDPSFKGNMRTHARSRGIVELRPRRVTGQNGYEASFEEVKPLRQRKVLVIGQMNRKFTVARLLANGNLDRSFGTRGKVSSLFGTTQKEGGSYATGTAIDAKGQILVAGYFIRGERMQDGHPVVVRLRRDGSFDRSFGRNGVARPKVPSGMRTTKIAIQKDGKIVVAGQSGEQFSLIRLNARGELDRGFFRKGRYQLDSDSSYSFAYDVMIDRRGRIVVAGGSQDWYSTDGFTIVRMWAR